MPSHADTVPITAPLLGTIVSVDVAPGDVLHPAARVAVIESMKMEHVVQADVGGVVADVVVAVGDTVQAGGILATVIPGDQDDIEFPVEGAAGNGGVRADLAAVIERHRVGLDEGRVDATERRHASGRRTARENVTDLCDPGSFREYGALAVAAQRRRRTIEDLIANTPADGLVAGTATINAGQFGTNQTRCVVMSYDYTVLAGTQGLQNHRKTDRMLELAHRSRLPVVFFTEGGGGRPGDTDTASVAGLDVTTFGAMARLSGEVPLVGIASGRCFAGNAALLGCCDVVIATPEASIGMGGPAMIEGGGLGAHLPDDVGPLSVQVPNGVVDIVASDDADAVRIAKQYVSYFQGTTSDRECPDQNLLRDIVPENRRRTYDVRAAIHGLADTGSVLELRPEFGIGVVCALVRVDGRPMGLVANNPAHLGGAIDRDAADKAARFLQLCDAHGLPVVSLCDTPGFMVGPDSERTATVRHFARIFLAGANMRVPVCAVILRKAYGLGAMAMFGGSTRAPAATVAWPTGEIGGMGLEGAVRLGFRKELEAIDDEAEREAAFDMMVAKAYENGKGLNAASVFEIDDVIDPADTRTWITAALAAPPPSDAASDDGRPHGFIDAW